MLKITPITLTAEISGETYEVKGVLEYESVPELKEKLRELSEKLAEKITEIF